MRPGRSVSQDSILLTLVNRVATAPGTDSITPTKVGTLNTLNLSRSSQLFRQALAHVTGEGEAEKQEQRAKRIDDVVHIKPVARALSISIPRQRSIQAIAKPIKKYEDIHQVQHQRILLTERVKRSCPDHTQESE